MNKKAVLRDTRIKVVVQMIVLIILLYIIISIIKITKDIYISNVKYSEPKVDSIERYYYKGEYEKLFNDLYNSNWPSSEEFMKYTEMALVYRAYEKYVFWNDIVERCEKDDGNLEYYEKYRLEYLKELSQKMNSLEYEENRRIMNKFINDAGIEPMFEPQKE